MAGHSKWANIKHRKGSQDKKRAKIFTKIIREIMISVKEGGDSIDSNPRLRLAIQNAKGENMPKDTIERAIKKALGADSENYIETTFEGYAPNGIAIFIETTTDNKNRTVSNIRAIFNKYGGTLGKNGSLEFIFTRKGVFLIKKSELKEMKIEDFEMEMIDVGLNEIKIENDIITLYSTFEDFGGIQKKLEELNITIKSAEIERIPITTKTLDIEKTKSILLIIDKFEEDDDVSKVYHNLKLTDKIINHIENT